MLRMNMRCVTAKQFIAAGTRQQYFHAIIPCHGTKFVMCIHGTIHGRFIMMIDQIGDLIKNLRRLTGTDVARSCYWLTIHL